MSDLSVGALIGWKRAWSQNGIVLTFQVAESTKAFQERDLRKVALAMNDRQLRSLARDLTRAAEERGIEIWPKKRKLFPW